MARLVKSLFLLNRVFVDSESVLAIRLVINERFSAGRAGRVRGCPQGRQQRFGRGCRHGYGSGPWCARYGVGRRVRFGEVHLL